MSTIDGEVLPETTEDIWKDRQRQRALNHKQFKQHQQTKARLAERQRKATSPTEIELLREEIVRLRTRVAALEIHSKQ